MSVLLLCVTSKSLYVVSWVTWVGKKYKIQAIFEYNADPAILMQTLGKIERIYEEYSFIYFEITRFKTEGFHETL